jgi:hypothetical protein
MYVDHFKNIPLAAATFSDSLLLSPDENEEDNPRETPDGLSRGCALSSSNGEVGCMLSRRSEDGRRRNSTRKICKHWPIRSNSPISRETVSFIVSRDQHDSVFAKDDSVSNFAWSWLAFLHPKVSSRSSLWWIKSQSGGNWRKFDWYDNLARTEAIKVPYHRQQVVDLLG